MTESSAWATLSALFRAEGAHVQRFEDKTAPGIPDANICRKGKDVWLEGKFLAKWPTRETTPVRVGLRPEQAVWLFNRQRAGGIAYVWVRCHDGWLLSQDWFILRDGAPRASLIATGWWFSTAKEMVTFIFR